MSSPVAVDAAFPLAQLPFAVSAVIVGLLSVLYLAYQWALPKPLPGIPYNEDAAKRIMGDAAELARIRKNGGLPRAWLLTQNPKHHSPIVQLFLAPFSKPTILVSDFREAQDVLLRRGKEFDRGARHLDTFKGIVPWHHIAMRTSDPQFKANRELVKDLMTPNFLNTVSAPEIYSNAMTFIDLWKLKARLANGRPFRAEDDITSMTFDIIKVVALGEGDSKSMTAMYTDVVRANAAGLSTGASGQDEPVEFPQNEPNTDQGAHQAQQDAINIATTQPFPKLFHKFNNRKPHMQESYRNKFAMLEKQVGFATRRLDAGGDVKSALDHMIQREIAAAQKAGRAPVFDSPSFYDEIYGYIGAGHETSATAFQWGLKHLARDQRVQTKLREALRAAYPAAAAEKRRPSFEEVVKSHVPYLEAFIEEVLRVTAPVRAVFREAIVDTTLLGHHVPKGTTVLFNLAGPSFLQPAFAIDEALRSPSSQAQKTFRGAWDPSDCGVFLPERWIKTEADGTDVFDPQAGPMLAFSSGVRGCFGRRLAYLQQKILVTLLVWNFEFGPLPEELNTFDNFEALTIKPKKCFVRLTEVS